MQRQGFLPVASRLRVMSKAHCKRHSPGVNRDRRSCNAGSRSRSEYIVNLKGVLDKVVPLPCHYFV